MRRLNQEDTAGVGDAARCLDAGASIAFPRGYDAVSYALELSLLDPGGSIDGSLVMFEQAAGRALPIFDRAVYGDGAP